MPLRLSDRRCTPVDVVEVLRAARAAGARRILVVSGSVHVEAEFEPPTPPPPDIYAGETDPPPT